MKFSKRDQQFKIRASKEFMSLIQFLVDHGDGSQADIIHKALAKYARDTYFGDYSKIQAMVEECEDDRNTRPKRRRYKKE